MKLILTLFVAFLCTLSLYAQTCPYLTGAMINGCGTIEGPNEFIVFNTGANSLNTSNLRFAYSNTSSPPFSASSVLYISGATSGIYGAKPAGLTLSGCASINIMSANQTIPANKNVVIMYTTTALTTFDLTPQCSGGSVYVLFVVGANALGSTGFVSTLGGNFSNSSGRSLNITNTASPCSSTGSPVAYTTSSWASNVDGNAVAWTSAGVASYSNNGCSLITAPPAVLPITLANFNVRNRATHIAISWVTLMEQNNAYFEVEHSTDGVTFETLETLRGAGNSNVKINYSTEHQNPSVGTHYYRLRQVDIDGKSTWSAIKILHNGTQSGSFWLSPSGNPTTLEVTSNVVFHENTTIEIFNMMGQHLIQTNVEKEVSTHSIDVSTLPIGQYLVYIKGNEQQSVLRFNR